MPGRSQIAPHLNTDSARYSVIKALGATSGRRSEPGAATTGRRNCQSRRDDNLPLPRGRQATDRPGCRDIPRAVWVVFETREASFEVTSRGSTRNVASLSPVSLTPTHLITRPYQDAIRPYGSRVHRQCVTFFSSCDSPRLDSAHTVLISRLAFRRGLQTQGTWSLVKGR